jgi:hypothetical protein
VVQASLVKDASNSKRFLCASIHGILFGFTRRAINRVLAFCTPKGTPHHQVVTPPLSWTGR